MSKDTYYHECPDCGEVLDPGERCSCKGPIEIVIGVEPLDPPSEEIIEAAKEFIKEARDALRLPEQTKYLGLPVSDVHVYPASDALVIKFDFSEGPDVPALCVGRVDPHFDISRINMFYGEEAKEMYRKLTTQNEEVAE